MSRVFFILNEIFAIGDTTTLEFTHYTKRTVLNYKWILFEEMKKENFNPEGHEVKTFSTVSSGVMTHKKCIRVEDVIAEVGMIKSWHVKAKNGLYYDESCIQNVVGYLSIGEIFDKVVN